MNPAERGAVITLRQPREKGQEAQELLGPSQGKASRLQVASDSTDLVGQRMDHGLEMSGWVHLLGRALCLQQSSKKKKSGHCVCLAPHYRQPSSSLRVAKAGRRGHH